MGLNIRNAQSSVMQGEIDFNGWYQKWLLDWDKPSIVADLAMKWAQVPPNVKAKAKKDLPDQYKETMELLGEVDNGE